MKARLLAIDEIPPEGARKIEFFGRPALVYFHEGQPRAVMDACMHLGGPLELKDGEFVCGWHGARFSCADGACKHGPARPETRLMFLPTRVEQGALYYVYGE
ncbi:MAG TPA: Rieske 2Fe-2S domain-containing protein [Gammaproteobacteria bacterium]|jgi:nitrite reductase/ring-hydroxylating ferredoxin subunit|nr:Rieske 2Fe-2S domain-containing protein [Gammaproteobacteria bacterium]